MKALRLRATVVLVSLVLAATISAQSKPTYTVGTVKEFLQRLGPDRTIILKKGDYKFWTAYDQKGPNFNWLDGDEGKELTVEKTDNLTIRGQDGARLITNSLKSYLMGFYGSAKLELDNLVFARQIDGTDAPDAGTLYFETVANLAISRSTFTGPSGYPLEIWECGEVNLKDVKIEGSSLGALSVGKTDKFVAKGGSVSKVQGFPLIYSEESPSVVFDGVSFADDTGGNFVEIYPTEGEDSSMIFTTCAFSRDQFDFFSGTKYIPETTNCKFDSSSFDETWPDNSVNLSSDQSYSGEEATQEYTDDASGLYFSYPQAWDLQQSSVPGRVAIFSTEDDSILFFAKAIDIKSTFNAVKDGPRYFSQALTALAKVLKDEGKMTLAASSSGDPYDFGAYRQAEYTGSITKQSGEKASVRLRLTLLPKGVWALVAVASDDYLLEDGGRLETVLSSLDSSQ